MPRLNQGLRLVEVLAMPGALSSFLRTRPFSSSAFLVARDLAAGCGPLGTIIDVGANAGQFSLAMSREFPDARILAFEPLPDVAACLRRNVSGHERIRVFECAAGSTPGQAPIHRHPYTLSSSLLPTTRAFGEVFPDAAGRGGAQPVEIDVVRLDDVVDSASMPGPVLLKLDVQGFEVEALKGAEVLLERCDWVLAEAAIERVYDGEPLFEDLRRHLGDSGFAFSRPVDFLRGARGTVSQMDVLFQRKSVEV